MINIDLLKSEMYKKEKGKLYIRTLLFNVTLIIIISLLFSGVAHDQKETKYIEELKSFKDRSDSLECLLTIELIKMKKRENTIIRSSLNLSENINYNDFIPLSDNIFDMVEYQSNTLNFLDSITTNRWDSISHIPIGSPISLGDLIRISDKYGWRKHTILKKWLFHDGTDFSAPIGTDIMSTSDGVITNVIISDKGYGNRVIIDHGFGYKTVYAHLNSFNVSIGDTIKRGDVIGYVGSTGRSTGPHLHYEILVNNHSQNPEQFFYNGDGLAMIRNDNELALIQ